MWSWVYNPSVHSPIRVLLIIQMVPKAFPADPDTMTNTTVEAIASSSDSGYSHNIFPVASGLTPRSSMLSGAVNETILTKLTIDLH